jgi:peptidoglycan/LPS O-acetylase OafA/YrhL
MEVLTRTSLGSQRLNQLDGWRALSILAVLAGHLLPLGPGRMRLNDMVATLGMAIFFLLSGFLITRFILDRPDPRAFLIRRVCRIVPLAWVGMAVGLVAQVNDGLTWLAHFAFFANLPPFWLTPLTAHFWSLCVEVHFYLLVVALVLIRGKRAISILPILAICVSLFRLYSGNSVSIVTYFRVDEILVGSVLCLAFESQFNLVRNLCLRTPLWLSLLLLALSCSPNFLFLGYARPWFALLCVGSTLFALRPRVEAILSSKPLGYIAQISFALYVIHPLLAHTWLGSGDLMVKYIKRPLLFGALWIVAHLSTFHFERYWIDLGKRLTQPKGLGRRFEV